MFHVMFHVEAVAHFVGQRSCLDAEIIGVDHDNRSGVVAGTHSTELGFPDYVVFEVDRRQQLGVIVGMRTEQGIPTILEEVIQGVIGTVGDVNAVVLVPYDHACQSYEDIQWIEEHVNVVDNVRAITMDGPDVFFKVPVERIVYHQH